MPVSLLCLLSLVSVETSPNGHSSLRMYRRKMFYVLCIPLSTWCLCWDLINLIISIHAPLFLRFFFFFCLFFFFFCFFFLQFDTGSSVEVQETDFAINLD